VLLTELLGQRGTHNLTTNIGCGGEMGLSALTARRTDVYAMLMTHPSMPSTHQITSTELHGWVDVGVLKEGRGGLDAHFMLLLWSFHLGA